VKLAKIKKLSLKTYAIALIIAFFVGLVLGGAIVYSQSSNENITIVSGSFTETASYVIFKVGDTIYAKNGTTGEIEYSGTNASYVINQAIASVHLKGGGTVFLKAGEYVIDSSIIIKEKVSLVGEMESKTGSAVTVIKRGTGFTGALLKTEVTYADSIEDNTQDIKIKNLIFNGNNEGVCLNLTNVDTCVIKECRIAYCEYAVWLGYYGDQTNDAVYPGDVRITDCRIHATKIAVYVERNLGDYFRDLKISDANYTLYIKCSKIIFVEDCSFYNFQTAAIKLEDDSNEHLESIIIQGNRFYTTHSAKYITITKVHSSTSRISINDNVFSYSALDRPDTFDLPKISYSSFRGNTGYHAMSEQSGTVTFSGTSYTFYHNLAKAPTLVLVSFNTTSYGGYTWTATDTQITITVQNSGNYKAYWYAEYNPFS